MWKDRPLLEKARQVRNQTEKRPSKEYQICLNWQTYQALIKEMYDDGTPASIQCLQAAQSNNATIYGMSVKISDDVETGEMRTIPAMQTISEVSASYWIGEGAPKPSKSLAHTVHSGRTKKPVVQEKPSKIKQTEFDRVMDLN
jgi:hypothetical protein